MVKRKSLLNPDDLGEIKNRILSIKERSERKWGKMTAAQMLRHCDRILQVGCGKIILPKIPFFVKKAGVIAKIEMKIFNNGIPRNMPTFKEVLINENCNFEKARHELLCSLDEFVKDCEKNNVVLDHVLFGQMTKYDWGFLQYKHLDHHLKQFGL
ncbi:MAG: DUF1569 domain-containing protein [Weeksellaceae bacterium]|nr:DUF1569 domain-containing protein [Bacteroidota bacterium]MCG2781018.1 DUF1569 domain-containing protein [Weeksellaceae bacterium]